MRILSYFFVLSLSLSTVCADGFFKYAEARQSLSLTVPADSEKENSFGGSAGLKLAFGKALWNLEARSYVTLPKTKASVLGGVESPGDFFALLDDVRYGAGIENDRIVPVSAKAGMLSLSKSVARLENPTPSSSANPLAKSFSFSSGIGANLPSLSSAVKPLAVFVDIAAPHRLLPVDIAAQCAVTEEKRVYGSVSCSIPISRLVSVQSVLTAGRMEIENKSKYLAGTNADFSSQWLYGLLWESAFRSPLVKANVSVGLQQMPFSKTFSPVAVWLKAATRLSYRNMLVDLSFFGIPTLSVSPKAVPLAGGSSTVCRTIRQFGANPQVQFELRNAYAATLRLGLHALFEKKILNTLEAEQYSTLRLTGGVAYESKPFTTKITAGVANAVLDKSFLTDATMPEACYSFDVSSSLALPQAKASLSAGYDRYPKSTKTGNTKDSFSLDLSISPGAKRMVTITAGADISYKNGERASSSVGGSATVQLKSTFIRTIFKCAMTVPL